jgi:hypothetical protein
MVDESLQTASRNFLGRAIRQKHLIEELFSLLEKIYPCGVPSDILVFHPPRAIA